MSQSFLPEAVERHVISASRWRSYKNFGAFDTFEVPAKSVNRRTRSAIECLLVFSMGIRHLKNNNPIKICL